MSCSSNRSPPQGQGRSKAVLQAAAGASYFNLVSVGTSLDFVKKTPARYIKETGLIAIDRPIVPPLRLKHSVATKAGEFLFLALGIVYYALPANLPTGLLSKNKRRQLGNGDVPVPYTGALAIVQTAVAAVGI